LGTVHITINIVEIQINSFLYSTNIQLDVGDEDVNEQALCSWDYRYDVNRTRQPKYIRYANCTSKHCNFNFLPPNKWL